MGYQLRSVAQKPIPRFRDRECRPATQTTRMPCFLSAELGRRPRSRCCPHYTSLGHGSRSRLLTRSKSCAWHGSRKRDRRAIPFHDFHFVPRNGMTVEQVQEGVTHPDELLGFVRCEDRQAGNQWEAADASPPASPDLCCRCLGRSGCEHSQSGVFQPCLPRRWEYRLGLQQRMGGPDQKRVARLS